VTSRLITSGVAEKDADGIAVAALRELGLDFESKNPLLTEFLVFIGRQDIERLMQLCVEHQTALLVASSSVPTDGDIDAGGESSRKGRKTKVAKRENLPVDFKKAIWGGRDAVDLALFGRMLAKPSGFNIDAASQVAHALSTNALSAEFDFFTAVDSLKPPSEDAGAGMLGTIEFNSSCYYRYANVDLRQLLENLGGNEALARIALRAFLQAAVESIPSGKQNTFAAHNPPSFVMSVVRDRAPWSLANAFVKPIAPRGETDLVAGSVAALDGYWDRLTTMYGDGGIVQQTVCLDPAYADRLPNLADSQVPSVAALIDRTLDAAAFDDRAG